MNPKFLCGGLLGLALLAAPAQATVIFSDNFDSENGGVGVLNYVGFANWTVAGGTVDLVNNGFFFGGLGSGQYVDLDGSSTDSGVMTHSLGILGAGNYLFSYDLAGSQRGSTDSVDVKVNNLISSVTHSLASSAGFATFSQSLTLVAPTAVTLSFEGHGGDNVGLLLDNVKLERVDAVPETSSTFGLLAGIVCLGAWLRRRTR